MYREIFQHADQIEMQLENTPHGIKVIETATDPYVIQLIQAHARVVSVLQKRFRRGTKNHDPPSENLEFTESIMNRKNVVIVGGGAAGITVAAQLLKTKNARRHHHHRTERKHYYQPMWTLVGGEFFREKNLNGWNPTTCPTGQLDSRLR